MRRGKEGREKGEKRKGEERRRKGKKRDFFFSFWTDFCFKGGIMKGVGHIVLKTKQLNDKLNKISSTKTKTKKTKIKCFLCIKNKEKNRIW